MPDVPQESAQTDRDRLREEECARIRQVAAQQRVEARLQRRRAQQARIDAGTMFRSAQQRLS